MLGWKDRLTTTLEPILRKPDPRPEISAYHDMPYAIFWYEPGAEFAVRTELSLLKTRLEQSGKRVTVISLAECLTAALEAEGMTIASLSESEISVGLDSVGIVRARYFTSSLSRWMLRSSLARARS